ncbi:hypothetical protein PR002_g75 [Phytophthora rubi]|uniref:Uncharacterized protein n=1 Tax=Phytophthora rubi TaxID=129364 RepID=A0A6A3NU51_9STRA|nr:hypothetical protein PR002_g75 [Phytophthora rubi]
MPRSAHPASAVALSTSDAPDAAQPPAPRSMPAAPAPSPVLSVYSESDSDTDGSPPPSPRAGVLATDAVAAGSRRQGRPVPQPHANPVSRSSGRAPVSRDTFDLSTFLSQFHSGLRAVPGSTPGISTDNTASAIEPRSAYPDVADHTSVDLGRVNELLHELVQLLQSGTPASLAAASVPTAAETAVASWSLPNHRGTLPPESTCELRAAHFTPPSRQARGDLCPTSVYILAAHRLYPHLLTDEGRHESPTMCVLRWRGLACLTFLDAAPVLAALYGARFGQYGISVMHFHRADHETMLAAGFSDANYTLDFSAAPPAPPACRSYHDQLGAVQGLTTFANAQWYDPMAHVLYRICEFVVVNMDADPGHSPRRVQRTLHQVNQLLGAVLVHLSSDHPIGGAAFALQRHGSTSTQWRGRWRYTLSPCANWRTALAAVAVAALQAAPGRNLRDRPPATSLAHPRPARNGADREHPRAYPGADPAHLQWR